MQPGDFIHPTPPPLIEQHRLRAKPINRLIRMHGHRTIRIARPEATLAGSTDWSQIAFGTEVVDGYTCRVYAGTIRLFGIGSYDVAETDVTLSAATEWVYVFHNLDHSTSGVTHSATEPSAINGTRYEWPLIKLTSSDGGASYAIDQRRHFGDIFLGSPIR